MFNKIIIINIQIIIKVQILEIKREKVVRGHRGWLVLNSIFFLNKGECLHFEGQRLQSGRNFLHLENKFSFCQENERETGSIERGYGGQLVERYLTCPIIIKTSFLWISWMVRNEKQSTLNRISS